MREVCMGREVLRVLLQSVITSNSKLLFPLGRPLRFPCDHQIILNTFSMLHPRLNT